MLNIFRETIQSIQDKTYGQKIVQKSTNTVFWYWLRYVLIFTVIYLVIFIVSATYQIPQLPKFAKDNLPSGLLTLENGKLTSTLEKATLIQSADFNLTIDPKAKVENPDSLPSGVFVSADTAYFKSGDAQVQSMPLTDVPNFSVSRESIASWFSENQVKIWIVVMLVSFVVAALLTALFVLIQLVSTLIWSAIFWLVFKIIRRPMVFMDLFKLGVYASVPWLIVSNILSVTPSPIFSWLNTGLFIFFVVSWATNLTTKQKDPEPTPKKLIAKKK